MKKPVKKRSGKKSSKKKVSLKKTAKAKPKPPKEWVKKRKDYVKPADKENKVSARKANLEKPPKPAAKKSGSRDRKDYAKVIRRFKKRISKGNNVKAKEHMRKDLKKPNKKISKQKHKKSLKSKKTKTSKAKRKPQELHVKTGVPGFDSLFHKGVPKGSAVLVAGGAGSGKTIFCLQTLINHAKKGSRCFYMSFEENEERLKKHMQDFGWDADKLIKSGRLKIVRYSPFEITRSVDAMLAKEKGELLIDLDPIIIPKNFKPDFIVLDSLTAVASAFTSKEDSYRIYIEQLFRFFEKMGTTSFLITETKQIPDIFSTTGVEEFLADGVVVFYNFKRGEVRENAVEILKMRGEKHQKNIVPMRITDKGVIVYPDLEVFGGMEKEEK